MLYATVDPDTFDSIESIEDIEAINKLADSQDNFRLGSKLKKKLKKAGRGLLAASTGGLSEVATKRGRKDLKKAAKDTGKALKKIGGLAAFAPLLPLVPMMKKTLKKKGKPVPSGVENISKAFYNEIVAKHDNFAPIDYDNDLDSDHVVTELVGGVIKGILEFVKGLKAKKQAGKTLSATEQDIVNGTEAVEKKLNEQAKDEAATSVGKRILFDRKTQIIIVVVIVAIIGVVWYIRRNK
jgi:hypothetical protein